jgi:hypothetical protein
MWLLRGGCSKKWELTEENYLGREKLSVANKVVIKFEFKQTPCINKSVTVTGYCQWNMNKSNSAQLPNKALEDYCKLRSRVIERYQMNLMLIYRASRIMKGCFKDAVRISQGCFTILQCCFMMLMKFILHKSYCIYAVNLLSIAFIS